MAKKIISKKTKELILVTIFAAIVISVGIIALRLPREAVVGRAYYLTQLSLDDYPYPFVENQEMNSIIVVGLNAPMPLIDDATTPIYNSLIQKNPPDNCPAVYNPQQEDIDNDGFGDACDCDGKDGYCTAADYCFNTGQPDADCNYNCSSDSDCGTDHWIEITKYCEGNEVWQMYRSYKCNNPGTVYSYCNYTDEWKQRYICMERCEKGECIGPIMEPAPPVVINISNETIINQTNISIACNNNADCGIDGFIGNPYCRQAPHHHNVWQKYKVHKCNNPGTPQSFCSIFTIEKVKIDCPPNTHCENAQCMPDPGFECVDSDNGIDIFVKGVAADNTKTKVDFCHQFDVVYEYYCEDATKDVWGVTLDCPDDHYCVDGACIDRGELSECIDTDGGKNYDQKGRIYIDNNFVTEDRCAPYDTKNDRIAEFYCDQDDSGIKLSLEYHYCPEGYICQDAVCVKQEVGINIASEPTYHGEIEITGYAILDYLDKDGDGVIDNYNVVFAENIIQDNSINEQNMIIIGRPGTNPLLDYFNYYEPKEGEGVIQLVQNDNYVALIVTGYFEEDILRAAEVLGDYSSYDFEGKDLYIISAPEGYVKCLTNDDCANGYECIDRKCIYAQPHMISLRPGQNLISLPVIPENTSFDDVLKNIDGLKSVYSYDVEGKWSIWHSDKTIPATPGFAAEPIRGYYIILDENAAPQNFSIAGKLTKTIKVDNQTIEVPPEIPVALGWNLLGVHSLTLREVQDYLFSIDGYYSAVYRMDEQGNIVPMEFDEPLPAGTGIWVFVHEEPPAGAFAPR